MNTGKIISTIRKELKKHIDLKYREGSKNFFKEKIKPYGVRIPNARKIGKELARKFNLNYEDTVKLSNQLLKEGWLEHCVIVAEFFKKFHKELSPKHFTLFESWIKKYVDNWAWCDWLSTDLIAKTIDKNPELVKKLIPWTKSKNRWVVRSAAVSLVPLVKKEKFVSQGLKIAKLNLLYKDDMIQKGTGWMLRELAKTEKQKVYAFLEKNKKIIGRTMLRYSIEHFTKQERKILMN